VPDSFDSGHSDDGVVEFYLENYNEFESTAQYEAWFAGIGEPFDFTGTSYLDKYTQPLRGGPTRPSIEFDERVEDARAFMAEHGGWPKFDEGKLAIILDLDEAIFKEGDNFLRESPAFLDEDEAIKLCAAGKELARIQSRDHKLRMAGIEFWGRLHQLGACSEMVREANHLLHLRGGDAAWLEEYNELRETHSNLGCLEYLQGVEVGGGSDAVRRDIEGDMAGIAQLHFRLGAMEEQEGSGVATKLLTALISRDVASARSAFSRDAAESEARARKAGFKSYTAFEVERLVGSTDPAAVADTSFLRIKVVERAVIQWEPILAKSMVGFAQVRRPCARARTSRLRSGPGAARVASRSRSSGDSDDGGGGSDPPPGSHLQGRGSTEPWRFTRASALIGLFAAIVSFAGAMVSVPFGGTPATEPVAVVLICWNESPRTGRGCAGSQARSERVPRAFYPHLLDHFHKMPSVGHPLDYRLLPRTRMGDTYLHDLYREPRCPVRILQVVETMLLGDFGPFLRVPDEFPLFGLVVHGRVSHVKEPTKILRPPGRVAADRKGQLERLKDLRGPFGAVLPPFPFQSRREVDIAGYAPVEAVDCMG
jgi:hypothetical protein